MDVINVPKQMTNNFMTVLDKKGNIIVCGNVFYVKNYIGGKEILPIYSVDGIHFFKTNSKYYDLILEEDINRDIKIKNKFKFPTTYWRNYTEDFDGVVIERNIEKACAPLIKVLNKFKNTRTYSSCCGHGTNPLYIYINTTNTYLLSFLKKYKRINLRDNGAACVIDNDYEIYTYSTGTKAYKLAAKLAKDLYSILENDK